MGQAAWTRTQYPGIRFREHPTRKHGMQPDRYYSMRYRSNGNLREEGLGWASQGMTAKKANETLSEILTNIRLGKGAQSLQEQRQEMEKQKEILLNQQEKAELTVDRFWNNSYFPACKITKTPRSYNTEQGYYVKWIRPVMGNLPLTEINMRHIETILHEVQAAGRAPATARYVMAVISQLWNRAFDMSLVSGESPLRRIKKPRGDNNRMRFLTEDEALKLLAALAKYSQNVHDMALLSLLCGLRAGECHKLTWADINFEQNTIFIRDPKNKKSRYAFMTNEVRTMLQQRAQQVKANELIFISSRGGMIEETSNSFNRAVNALGLNNNITDRRQKIVFHSLRHTFASWLVQRGVPLYDVANLMGHSTLEMTKRYAHLAPDNLRKAMQTLEGIMQATPNSCYRKNI